jgi:hypothetical protein
MVPVDARGPTAILVVAAWAEGVRSRVAARITFTQDVTRSERVMVTASGLDEITDVIRSLLEQVRADPGDAAVTDE